MEIQTRWWYCRRMEAWITRSFQLIMNQKRYSPAQFAKKNLVPGLWSFLFGSVEWSVLTPWPWVFLKYIHDWSLFEGVKSLDTVAVFMAMQNPSNANIVMQVSHESALWMPIWRNISTLHYNLASIPVFSCISTMKITVTWHSNGSSTIVFVCTYKLILSASKVLKHKSDYSAS